MTRPATRVGRYVLFEGGKVVKLPTHRWLLHVIHPHKTIKADSYKEVFPDWMKK